MFVFFLRIWSIPLLAGGSDERPTDDRGVTLRAITVPFDHDEAIIRKVDYEVSFPSGSNLTKEQVLDEMLTLDTNAVISAKISEELSQLRKGTNYNYSYYFQRYSIFEAQLKITVSPLSTSNELPRERIAIDRMYKVAPSEVMLYEKSPVDFHLAVCMRFFTKKFKMEPGFREAVFHPSSGFRIRIWTETYTNVVLLALTPIVVMYCKKVSREKASGVVELMSSMGADRVDFYLSHALFAYIHGLIVTMILVIPALLYFFKVSYLSSILIVSIVLPLPAALISLVCSTFSKSPFSTVTWCILVWVCLFLLSFAAPSLDSYSFGLYISNLNPLTSFKSYFESIATYHVRGSPETGLLITVYPDIFSMFESFVFMLTSCFLMILYLFIHEVYSPEFTAVFQTYTTKVKSAKSEGFELEKNEEWIDRAVTLNNVYKYWHSTKELAIGNISFSAYYGQVTALLGHDGSGKTTIMKLISGDIDPTREVVRFE